MKKARILHNPNAGKGEYTKKELCAILQSQGFKCGYSSTKEKGWKETEDDPDLIVIAGGDGTVRKVTVKMLAKLSGKIPPLALLPLGTANNIARSLGIEGHAKEIIGKIDFDHRKKFDVGKIGGIEEAEIFLESFGYGVFPELMKAMKDDPVDEEMSPEDELVVALERIQKIILAHRAEEFRISIDGMEHTGNYLLVEVMNISSIGPNLGISPNSDPGDGEFEVVLIPESQREEFATYITGKIQGGGKQFLPMIVKGSEIGISTNVTRLHADDELISLKDPSDVKIRTEKGMMDFLVQ